MMMMMMIYNQNWNSYIIGKTQLQGSRQKKTYHGLLTQEKKALFFVGKNQYTFEELDWTIND